MLQQLTVILSSKVQKLSTLIKLQKVLLSCLRAGQIFVVKTGRFCQLILKENIDYELNLFFHEQREFNSLCDGHFVVCK